MNNFQTAVTTVVNEMIKLNLTECTNISWNDSMDDQATVYFLGEDGSSRVHTAMRELHVRLSSKLSYPVYICHTSPTDGQVQVLSGPDNAEMYYSDECCKRKIIMRCKPFLANRIGYNNTMRSIFLAAECLAADLGKTPEKVLEELDWNEDPQAQLIKLLIDCHN